MAPAEHVLKELGETMALVDLDKSAELLQRERKRMGGFIQEFKTFAVKGNAMDMAVGIILGAAFNKVV